MEWYNWISIAGTIMTLIAFGYAMYIARKSYIKLQQGLQAVISFNTSAVLQGSHEQSRLNANAQEDLMNQEMQKLKDSKTIHLQEELNQIASKYNPSIQQFRENQDSSIKVAQELFQNAIDNWSKFNNKESVQLNAFKEVTLPKGR